jgi:hypothetical protein
VIPCLLPVMTMAEGLDVAVRDWKEGTNVFNPLITPKRLVLKICMDSQLSKRFRFYRGFLLILPSAMTIQHAPPVGQHERSLNSHEHFPKPQTPKSVRKVADDPATHVDADPQRSPYSQGRHNGLPNLIRLQYARIYNLKRHGQGKEHSNIPSGSTPCHPTCP